MIRVSRIIAELDAAIARLTDLRRELLVDTELMNKPGGLLKEHQANQHGHNPMGKDGEPR